MLIYYITPSDWVVDHPRSQICPRSELVVVGTRPLGLAFSAAALERWGFPMDFPWISGFNVPKIHWLRLTKIFKIPVDYDLYMIYIWLVRGLLT